MASKVELGGTQIEKVNKVEIDWLEMGPRLSGNVASFLHWKSVL